MRDTFAEYYINMYGYNNNIKYKIDRSEVEDDM
jgi:hypothetical protein